MSLPTSGSAADILATLAISADSLTGLAILLSSSATTAAAFSIPRRIAIGLAPAATFLIPASIIA